MLMPKKEDAKSALFFYRQSEFSTTTPSVPFSFRVSTKKWSEGAFVTTSNTTSMHAPDFTPLYSPGFKGSQSRTAAAAERILPPLLLLLPHSLCFLLSHSHGAYYYTIHKRVGGGVGKGRKIRDEFSRNLIQINSARLCASSSWKRETRWFR